MRVRRSRLEPGAGWASGKRRGLLCPLRLQKEIEVLEDAGPLPTAGDAPAAPSPAKAHKAEVLVDSQQVRGC